jgi:hypothetical protein
MIKPLEELNWKPMWTRHNLFSRFPESCVGRKYKLNIQINEYSLLKLSHLK